MGDFKHLAVVKFKDGVDVDEILTGLQDMISHVDTVKSFEWGQDLECHDMDRQGFTHVFSVAFGSKDEFDAGAQILQRMSSMRIAKDAIRLL